MVAAETPGTILVIAVSRIGDSLFATPAIRALAAAYPGAEITVLGHPNRVEIFENLPFVANVGATTKNRALWRGWLPVKRYDLALVYHFDAALVAYALRVSRRVVAFRQDDDRINRRLFRCVDRPPFQSEHAVRQLLRLPQALGIAPAGLRLSYRCSELERKAARARLQAIGAEQRRPLIGLQVASFPTKAYRDWPVENFAELCERISAHWPGAHFLIFGGPEERTRTAWLQERLGSAASLLAGRLSLRETTAMMGLIDCYVGVDTGPTHLMSTWDIPLVGMFHCLSSSAHTGPLDHPMAYLIDHPASDSDRCCEESDMADITVDAVFGQVMRALTEHPPQPR